METAILEGRIRFWVRCLGKKYFFRVTEALCGCVGRKEAPQSRAGSRKSPNTD